MERVTLNVAGMSCGHCVGAVTNALEAVPGVKVETVTIGSATVAYDAGATSVTKIAKAVADAGYTAQPAG